MKNTRKEIPHWVWYTGQFLFHAQESFEQRPNQTIGNVFTSFLRNQNMTDSKVFTLKNQGSILMLLYGLVVVPKEIWGSELLDKSFPFTTRKEFRILKPERNLRNSEIIKLLRNAISHANFDIYSGLDQYIFWNINNGQRNFEAVVSHEGIGKFLTEIANYYINHVIIPDAQQQ
jgi:hypothetical protein